MATAYYLSRESRAQGRPIAITLLEASERLGGVIQTERRDGFLFEAGPDAMLAEPPWAAALCRELGLEPDLIPTQEASRRSGIVWRGRIHEIPQGWYLLAPVRLGALARMPMLSWPARLRIACEPLIPARRDDGDESVASFVRRRFGREALERIGQPMIGGIYTADAEQLSLHAALPRFREMERSHGSVIRALMSTRRGPLAEAGQASGPRYSLFVSLRNGLAQFVEALRCRLEGVALRTTAAVESLVGGPPWRARLRDGTEVEAESLCLALPAPQAARILREPAADVARALDGIAYESVATINLAFRPGRVSGLSGFGFVVPAAEGRPLVGCSFSSAKFPGRAPAGGLLVRLFIGGALQRRLLERDDAELVRLACEQLRELVGLTAAPMVASVRRFSQAMPQYLVGHLDRVARIESLAARQAGLFLTGNAYRGVGIPDCIHQAEQTAARMIEWLEQRGGDRGNHQ